jgi:hypothetical protein
MAQVPEIKITIQDCWVSCDERMPEPFTPVLVSGGVGLWTGTQWNTITGYEWPGMPIAWPVAYWMPMLLPPKK